jgi:hypothetical protein
MSETTVAERIGQQFMTLHGITDSDVCDSAEDADIENLIQSKEKCPSWLIAPEPVRSDDGRSLLQNGKYLLVKPSTSGIEQPMLVLVARIFEGGIEHSFDVEREVIVKDADGNNVLVKDENGNMITKKEKQKVTLTRFEGMKVRVPAKALKSSDPVTANVINSLDIEGISRDKGKGYVNVLSCWKDDFKQDEVETI